jgi:hypothetical protein
MWQSGHTPDDKVGGASDEAPFWEREKRKSTHPTGWSFKRRYEENVNEALDDTDAQNDSSSADDNEGNMAKAQLMNLNKQAGELYNMVNDGDSLEAWVQDKLSKAADYINVVYNYMQYEKNKPTSIGNGMGTPADSSANTPSNV